MIAFTRWWWGEDGAAITEVDGVGRRIAAPLLIGERPPTEQQRADRLERAKLIVTAVNAHPVLVAFVKEMGARDMEHDDDCAWMRDNLIVAAEEGRNMRVCDCYLARLKAAMQELRLR